MFTRKLLASACILALSADAFAAGLSHTARRPGGLRGTVTNDASATAEIRNLISEVRNSITERDKQTAETIKKAETDIVNFGKITEETKAKLTEQVEASAAMQGRLQNIEQALAALKTEPDKQKRNSLGELVLADAGLKAWLNGGATSNSKASIKIDRFKNAVTELGSGQGAAGEIIIPQRVPGWVYPANRILTIRDLLPQGRTTSNAVDFVQETGFTNSAAPVAEGALKPESSLEFTLRTAPVRTIAHWLQASKQVLDDIPQLESYINTRLTYGLKLVEEEQLLAGDGTGQNLLGLIPQATPFDRSRRKVGDTRIDIIRRAMTQLRLSQYQPDAVVLHPTDWEDIELTKNSLGSYIWGNPSGLLGPTIWGLPVVESTSLAPGEFLVGAFKIAAQIWDRDDVQIDISTEDRDNFIRNMVTIRVEERLALVVYRPESFIFGDFEDDVSHP
jgi:HK97 family phage major capsid protein